MTDLRQQITTAHQLEQQHKRKVFKANEIPVSYEDITPEWLTDVLCKGHPGAKVLSHELDAPDDGTTDRRRIFVIYNDIGNAARLPPSVFCKASQRLDKRLMLAYIGFIDGEYIFFNRFRSSLDIEAPVCYLANRDPVSYNSIFVFDDAVRSGTQFCEHTTSITRQRAEGQIDILATVHGRFYDSPETRDPSLPAFSETWHSMLTLMGLPELCKRGFHMAEETIPVRLLRRDAEIWPATEKSAALHTQTPLTFTHNDVHVRNWYVAGNGKMGLADWQNFAKGHWSRDFAYVVSSSLKVEDRRAWEKELLKRYLDNLRAAGGPSIAFAEAWNCYRQSLFSAMAWWTGTLGLPDAYSKASEENEDLIQPLDAQLALIGRMATAIDDLDALGSFDH
jgi:hypothetical protein